MPAVACRDQGQGIASHRIATRGRAVLMTMGLSYSCYVIPRLQVVDASVVLTTLLSLAVHAAAATAAAAAA